MLSMIMINIILLLIISLFIIYVKVKQYNVTTDVRKVIDSIGDDLKKMDWKKPVDVALFRKKWGFK